jgi:hypothetical protein
MPQHPARLAPDKRESLAANVEAGAGGSQEALRHAESDAARLWPSKPSKYRQGRMCAFGERREGRLVLDDRAALRARRFHYMGTMTDNAPGTHSKVIGSSPSVWAHTVPGADHRDAACLQVGNPGRPRCAPPPATPRRWTGWRTSRTCGCGFDVLTKTKQPELCRYWTTRDRAAKVRLYRLAAEILQAIEAGVFHPNPGWQCKDCQFRSQCWAWR